MSTETYGSDAPVTTARNSDVVASAAPRGEDHVVGRTVTINRPRAEVFAFFRDFTNLATVMENVVRIDRLDDKRSHWVVSAPAGRTVEWDAVVTEERSGSLIAWESAEGADVRNSGRVEFRDGPPGRGTEVSATIAYDAPGGAIGTLIAKLFQKDPAIQARRDLRRLKQFLETGEVTTAANRREDRHNVAS